MKFKIAVVQFAIRQFDIAANLARVEKFMTRAARKGAQVIVFPEEVITGPVLHKKEYCDYSGTYRKNFQVFAKRHGIDVVTGSFIEGDEKGWYNTSYYIDAHGKILERYKKINLWLPERPYVKPGKRASAFDTKFGRAGLIICWDLMFPEIFRRMVAKGVKLIYCPSFWTVKDAGPGLAIDARAEQKSIDALCVARAFENGLVLAFANAAGRFELDGTKDRLVGHSQITVPFQGALKRITSNKEAMFIQEVDTDILHTAETAYKIRNDLALMREAQDRK